MKILLDAHISGKKIGSRLARGGHNVRSADSESDLEGLDDVDLLEIAVNEGRIMVTFDIKDFAPLFMEWAEAGRNHAGCVFVTGFRNNEIGAISKALIKLLGERSKQSEWIDRISWLSPARQ